MEDFKHGWKLDTVVNMATLFLFFFIFPTRGVLWRSSFWVKWNSWPNGALLQCGVNRPLVNAFWTTGVPMWWREGDYHVWAYLSYTHHKRLEIICILDVVTLSLLDTQISLRILNIGILDFFWDGLATKFINIQVFMWMDERCIYKRWFHLFVSIWYMGCVKWGDQK